MCALAIIASEVGELGGRATELPVGRGPHGPRRAAHAGGRRRPSETRGAQATDHGHMGSSESAGARRALS
eukprot:9023442-Alexandrium_andersonii.AAC.1